MKNWKELGFKNPPIPKFANGNEIFYRVYGGKSKLIGDNGIFLTPLKINSVSEAEKNLNIAQYGNQALMRGVFKVKAGTKLWIGEVAGEQVDFIQMKSDQIYIEEKDKSALSQVMDPEKIKQDLSIMIGNNTTH